MIDNKSNLNTINSNSWGKPYKGYKNLYYKDWIIKSESSSDWITIRNGKWGNISDDKISNIIKTSVGLLVGGISAKAGAVYTVSELLISFLPKNVTTSTKVKFEVKLHIPEKIEKHTYVREGSIGSYSYAALTQKVKYNFQKSVTIPGKKAVTNKYTNYTIVETQNFRKPDVKAWNSIYNPWIERLGTINYGGVSFNLD